MASNIIHRTKLKKYERVMWRGQVVYQRYAQLKNHLTKHLGGEYELLLAKPQISRTALKGTGEAYWLSELSTSELKKITSLSEGEQAVQKRVLAQKLKKIHQHIQELESSQNSEDRDWAELLSLAFTIPDEESVLVGKGEVVLVVWGFELAENEKKNYSLKQGLKKKVNLFASNFIPFDKEDGQEQKTEEIKDEEKPPQTKEIDEDIENVPEEKNPPKDPKSELKQENTSTEKREVTEVEEKSEVTEIVPPPTHEKEENEDEGDKEENGGGKKKWRGWLLLLFLILLLIVLYFIFGGDGKKNLLPEEPGVIIPIDSTKITKDPDGIKEIISDRLNVALVGDNKNIEKFAEEFKKVYPKTEYQIIYYDTLTHRVQLQVPESEREIVKKELQSKLSDFKMLVWHEGIFEQKGKPSDPGFNDPKQSWYHDRVQAFKAWDVTRGDSNLVVAIVDNGFDGLHPELSDKIYKPWNVPQRSPNVNTGINLVHGTHVAGIALGFADNGLGVAGLAPNCRFMPVQVGDKLGRMSTTAVIDGVLYAMHNGAKVINLSLGMSVPPDIEALPPNAQQDLINRTFKGEEEFWNQLFEEAHSQGISIVLAAGNQDVLIGLDPMQRSPYAINVSAIGSANGKANFSNYGKGSTISAPGVGIYSSLPNNRFDYLDGTSMAAPVVTGGIALMKSANPVLSPSDIVEILQTTGIPINPSNGYVGNLIQLADAVRIADLNRGGMPKVGCPDLQAKIDSLLWEIEKIKLQCPEHESTDTMYIPDEGNDLEFAVGRWKSTTHLYNEQGEKVVIYFDFYNDGTGEITLVEPNNTSCFAPLAINLNAGQFTIEQLKSAVCSPPPKVYAPYSFECEADQNGQAECWAQNQKQQTNNFRFKLVKISNHGLQ